LPWEPSAVRRIASGREYRQGNVGLGDQQHDALKGSAVAHPPLHLEAVRDAPKPVCSAARFDREIGGGEHHPHEEMPVSTSSNCWASRMFCRYGRGRSKPPNDAGTIRTGQGQHELMIGHGAAWYN
jgi:hypothetical protein